MSNPTYDPHFYPDFVVLGFRRSADEVEVWASRDLTRANLEALMDPYYEMSYDWAASPRPIVYGYELTAGLRTFVLVRARTYGEALRVLMDQWNPDEPATAQRRELPPAPPAALGRSRPELEA